MKNEIIPSISEEALVSKIYFIRGKKVMLDSDLAELYGVSTGNLNKAVKRNIQRFPEDFMYQLERPEVKNLIFHPGTSNWGGRRQLPYVFTEQGVAMLSSILKSNRAIQVNIQIMRIFTKMRELIFQNLDLKKKIDALEKNYQDHDERIREIFFTLKKLMEPPLKKSKKEIGFHTAFKK